MFQSATYALGGTFGFLRFYIIAVPFAATLALLAVPDGTFVPAIWPGRNAPPPPTVPTTRFRGGYPAGAAAMAICVLVAGWGMNQPRYAPQEYALEAVYHPEPDNTDPVTEAEQRIARTFAAERRLAAYLDDLNLPDSSIVVDTVYGFAVVAASRKPKTFVLPSDPDFVRILNDPSARGAKYLLAVPPTGRGRSDTLNKRYPTLYDNGADVATLELEIANDGDGQPNWRLYRVYEPGPGR